MKNYKFVWRGLAAFLLSVLLHSTVFGQNSGNKGYINRTGVDLLTGKDGRNIRLLMSHGYHVTNRLIAGVGTGYAFYNDPADIVPIFVDITWLLSEGKSNPFFQFRFGSGISILKDQDIEPDTHRAAASLGTSFGFQFTSENGAGIYLSAGVNMDQLIMEWEEFGGRSVRDLNSYRRISLSFGFVFF